MSNTEGPQPPRLVEESFDVEWEATLAREPYDVDLWLEYAQDKTRRGLSPAAVAMVYERALARLPGSYKLWHSYLAARRGWITSCPATPGSPLVASLNATFERCLLFMGTMPRIWLLYCQFLVEQRAITKVRETFDRALCALPVSQHGKIWDAYAEFVLKVPQIPWQTAERILKRRCKIDPDEGRAALVAFLRSKGRFGEAARELSEILDTCKDEEVRKQTRTELVALVREHPEECRDFCDMEAICRSPPADAREERVKTLTSLADYFIRLGSFEQAREIFEELMSKECHHSIHDFSTVFEMYSKFEEAVLDDCEEQLEGSVEVTEDERKELEEEAGLRIKRMRNLLDRRVQVSGSVFLRAWPGDVKERLALATFYERQKDYARVEATILEAFPETEHLELTNGRGSSLFLWLAKAVSTRENVADPVRAQDKALSLGCRRCWEMRDLVDLWRARIELHVENDQTDRALRLAREALTPPGTEEEDSNALNNPQQQKKKRRPYAHRSPQLWSLYLDLEESCGTFESARAAYEQAMDTRVCSVWNVLNFCKLLRKHNYHEDSYVVFERAVAMFPWPHAKDLWIEYSKQFVERFGGSKIERARDLFEQCIASIPESSREHAEFAFFAYVKFEETFGLARRAMAIYKRWCDFVPDKQQLDAYMMWAAKSEEIFGAPAARKVYEEALNVLPELDVARISIRFADAESRLGEYERARAILKHGSQFTDPRDPKKDVGLWQAWNDFEIKFGNEETFREMLRVKRSVEAHFGILHAGDAVVQYKQQQHQQQQSSVPPTVTASAMPKESESTPSITPDVESRDIDANEIDIDDEE